MTFGLWGDDIFLYNQTMNEENYRNNRRGPRQGILLVVVIAVIAACVVILILVNNIAQATGELLSPVNAISTQVAQDLQSGTGGEL